MSFAEQLKTILSSSPNTMDTRYTIIQIASSEFPSYWYSQFVGRYWAVHTVIMESDQYSGVHAVIPEPKLDDPHASGAVFVKKDIVPVATFDLKSTFEGPFRKIPQSGMEVWCIDHECCNIQERYDGIGVISDIGVVSGIGKEIWIDFLGIGKEIWVDFLGRRQMGCPKCLVPVTMIGEGITQESIQAQSKVLSEKCKHGIFKITCPQCYDPEVLNG